MLKPDRTKFPYRIGRFDMAQSNFMVRRYNVKSLPCYLSFFGGKLVTCQPMGGKAVHLTRSEDAPRALLFEPDFASQIKTEKIMQKLGWRWDLCMTLPAAMARAKTLADSGKHLGPSRQGEYIHRAIFVNSNKCSPNDARSLKQFLARQAGGSQAAKKILFVAMLPMGTVGLAKLPLDLSRPPSEGSRPLACPRTGVVVNATPDHLCGGVCDFAVIKDIRRGGVTELPRRSRMRRLNLWAIQSQECHRRNSMVFIWVTQNRTSSESLQKQRQKLNKADFYRRTTSMDCN